MKKLLVALLTLPACALAVLDNPVQTVPSVNLESYVGKWYEIASIPASFQKKCERNTTAEYEVLEDELVKVLNSCDVKSGERDVAEGRARIEDEVTNAKLKVTFVKLFGKWLFSLAGDYWVIDLADDYSYSVVGHPTREYGWILSRTPNMDAEVLADIVSRLEAQDYDPCLFMVTPQDGGRGTRQSLCDAL